MLGSAELSVLNRWRKSTEVLPKFQFTIAGVLSPVIDNSVLEKRLHIIAITPWMGGEYPGPWQARFVDTTPSLLISF